MHGERPRIEMPAFAPEKKKKKTEIVYKLSEDTEMEPITAGMVMAGGRHSTGAESKTREQLQGERRERPQGEAAERTGPSREERAKGAQAKELKLNKLRENAVQLTRKKLEAGMDAADLEDQLKGQLEELDELVENLEDDQSVILEEKISQREQVLSQLKALEDYRQEEGKEKAA